MTRTLTGETPHNIGERVTIAGWVDTRRDHGKIVFLDVRDREGVVQVVFTPEAVQAYEAVRAVRPEWVVQIEGKVRERPDKLKNAHIPTGGIEIAAESLVVLTQANTLPLPINTDGYEIGEDVRLKYRYLDLRRKRLQRNLKIRHEGIQFIRAFLTQEGFVEVETPVLSKSTPEGARDFLVPSRLYPGTFYALPQSPQQYKQLLQVAGLERYFQIVRCFRDEDPRADRQAEFTQLDIEMSFIAQEDVLELIERLYIQLVEKLFPGKHITQTPFLRITHKHAMKKWKSDKPDLRENKGDPNELAFVFIVDFPAFEWREQEQRWDAVHHPFTKIQNPIRQLADKTQNEFIKEIKNRPSELLAHQYDLVLNGYEIGGGSMRETDPAILEAVFECMGNSREDIKAKFGHLLEAFKYGVPPHGGIASGLDRLFALLLGESNIREVMAFPKTGDNRDLMMDAPSEVSEQQLRELRLRVSDR